MKNFLVCILFSTILFACRKERITPDEIRLLKTTTGGPNGSKKSTNFEYDSQGRIVQITRNTNNEPAKRIAVISYNGNEVTLFDTSENNTTSKIEKTVKFVLDNDRKPLQRIQIETWQLLDPAYEQKNFIADTTYYEYNSAGLLTEIREVRRDSVWFFQYAQGLETHINLQSITRSFQNNSNNVVSVSGSGTRFYRVTNTNGTLSKNYTQEELTSFDYSNQFNNQTDFKNAFILAEYGGDLFFSFLQPNVKNIPNKVITSSVEKDDTGTPVLTNSFTANYKVFYNGYGFLSGFTLQNTNSPDLVLTYNR